MPKNPTDVAKKWAQNTGGATQAYIAGVQGVTTSPTAKAAANLGKYVQKTQDAVNSGKMARRLNSVSLGDWQQASTGRGAQKLAAGAQAAQPKMEAFMGQWLPFVYGVQSKIKAMPNVTVADREARMLANARALAQFKRS